MGDSTFISTPVFPSDIWSNVFNFLPLEDNYFVINSSITKLLKSSAVSKKFKCYMFPEVYNGYNFHELKHPFESERKDEILQQLSEMNDFIYSRIMSKNCFSHSEVLDIITSNSGIEELEIHPTNDKNLTLFRDLLERQAKNPSTQLLESLRNLSIIDWKTNKEELSNLLILLSKVNLKDLLLYVSKIHFEGSITFPPLPTLRKLIIDISSKIHEHAIVSGILISCPGLQEVELWGLRDESILTHLPVSVKTIYIKSKDKFKPDKLASMLQTLKSLRSLYFFSSSSKLLTQEILEAFASLKEFDNLYMDHIRIPDNIANVRPFPSLREISIQKTTTQNCIALLQLLPPSVQVLDFHTDKSMRKYLFSKFINLKKLSIENTREEDVINHLLSNNTGTLQRLEINVPAQTTIQNIGALTQLKSLYLYEMYAEYFVAFMKICPNLKNLHKLVLSGEFQMGLTFENITPLENVKELRILGDTFNPVFEVSSFFPNVEILHSTAIAADSEAVDLNQYPTNFPKLKHLSIELHSPIRYDCPVKLPKVHVIPNENVANSFAYCVQAAIACRECENFEIEDILDYEVDDMEVVAQMEHIGEAFFQYLKVNLDKDTFKVLKPDWRPIFECQTIYEIGTILNKLVPSYLELGNLLVELYMMVKTDKRLEEGSNNNGNSDDSDDDEDDIDIDDEDDIDIDDEDDVDNENDSEEHENDINSNIENGINIEEYFEAYDGEFDEEFDED